MEGHRINVLKIFNKLNAVPDKVPIIFFTEIEKKIVHVELSQTASTILRNENNAVNIITHDLKVYCRNCRDKVAWYWPLNRHSDQWSKIQGLNINPQDFFFFTKMSTICKHVTDLPGLHS